MEFELVKKKKKKLMILEETWKQLPAVVVVAGTTDSVGSSMGLVITSTLRPVHGKIQISKVSSYLLSLYTTHIV